MNWKTFYTQGEYHKWPDNDPNHWAKMFVGMPYHRKRLYDILDRIDFPSIIKNKDVLEVAFNDGKTVFWTLDRYGQIFNCSMFDINPKVVAWAKRVNKKWKIDIFEADVQHITKRDNSFDFIFCLDVIEHLPDTVYKKMIKELYRILKKDGQVLVLIGKGKAAGHIHVIPDEEAIGDFEKEGFHFLDKFQFETALFWRVVKKK